MADTDTIEREDTLELIDTSQEEDLSDEDVIHSVCCAFWLLEVLHRPNYALCGVLVTEMLPSAEVTCETCLEVLKSSNGHICPAVMFGGMK